MRQVIGRRLGRTESRPHVMPRLGGFEGLP